MVPVWPSLNHHPPPRLPCAETYRRDLARIHDEGFRRYTDQAVTGALAAVADTIAPGGRVVELGCGAGRLLRALLDAGYEATGVDASAELLALAATRVPADRLTESSWVDVDVPSCDSVLAFGEVLGYLTDPRAGRPALRALFSRVAGALRPGGLLMFDLAGPGRSATVGRRFWEGDGWLMTNDTWLDGPRTLVRTMSSFTLEAGGANWRRDDEEHRLGLLSVGEITDDLRAAGLVDVASLDRLPGTDVELPPGLGLFSARAPA